MRSIIPFEIKCSPIKKLALIPFENNPERLYRGFELQYIEGADSGSGYRVLGYRNDNYVDVYDDHSLIFNENEEFNVAENGLNKHVQTNIENACFEKRGSRQRLSFKFTDIENRTIEFYCEEKTDRNTVPMNLLAPIGLGSKKPNFLPLFFMYDFDFLRRKAEVKCSVDGTDIRLDKFPFPMNGQLRSYVRYSSRCELLEFASAVNGTLCEAELNNSAEYNANSIAYRFGSENVLESITVSLESGDCVIGFKPALDMNKSGSGQFRISPSEKMGYISGSYSVQRDGCQIKLNLSPDGGWTAVPTSFVSKMVLNRNSVFCTWSKGYEYNSIIDLTERVVKSSWTNHNIDSKGK